MKRTKVHAFFMSAISNARAAIAAMREKSEQNGNAELTLEDINNEIWQAR